MTEEKITIAGFSVEALKIIFTALTKGIWAIHENGRIAFVYPFLIRFGFTRKREPILDIPSPFLRVHLSGGTTLFLKDYGKTWWLTKEEIKK